MNVRVLMALFVLSWTLWACMPLWGSATFAAIEVATLFGVTQRNRSALAAVRGEFATLAEALPADARSFFEKYAFFYTQRAQASEWAGLLRAVGLAALLLIPVFALHALLRTDLKPLIAIVPAALFFVLNAVLAPSLEVDDWVKDDGKAADRALHETVSRAIAEKNAAAAAALLGSAPGARLAPPPGTQPPP